MTAPEQVRRQHIVTAPEGCKLADVLEPKFWRNCARDLNVPDRIEVHAADGTFYAELFVRDVAQGWVKVVVHTSSEHKPVTEVGEEDWAEWQRHYQITHSAREGWIVVRLSDRATMLKAPSEAEIHLLAREHARNTNHKVSWGAAANSAA